MKRFAITVACVGSFAFGSLATSQGAPVEAPQLKKANTIKPGLSASVRSLPPDLAVTQFSVALRRTSPLTPFADVKYDYVVHGGVTNLGPSDFFATARVDKGFQGARRIQVFAVIKGGLGKEGSFKLLRTIYVPSIKARGAWTPTIIIPASQVPASANGQFLLMLTAGDNNSGNDWRQARAPVNPVR